MDVTLHGFDLELKNFVCRNLEGRDLLALMRVNRCFQSVVKNSRQWRVLCQHLRDDWRVQGRMIPWANRGPVPKGLYHHAAADWLHSHADPSRVKVRYRSFLRAYGSAQQESGSFYEAWVGFIGPNIQGQTLLQVAQDDNDANAIQAAQELGCKDRPCAQTKSRTHG